MSRRASTPPPLDNLFKRRESNDTEDDNIEDSTPEEMLLEAVDRIEDEIDEWSFKHVVPLPIRLFFENYVFGWTHLCSDILGHILYPLLCSLMTYYLYTWLIFGFGGKQGESSVFSKLLDIVSRLSDDVQGKSHDISPHPKQLHNFISTHDSSLRLLRVLLTVSTAIITFRTVRRRVRVWLRNPYGSRGYIRDSQYRDLEVEDVDRTTLLGRLRRRRERFLAKRVQKKLLKAAVSFERKKKRE
jgi:hypothetical protein